MTNTEIYYRALDFYLVEHPLLLNDLLLGMWPVFDSYCRVCVSLYVRVCVGVCLYVRA